MARKSERLVHELSEKAWTEKAQTTELLKECYDFALPDRNPYTYNGTGKPEGQAGTKGKDKSSRKVFDSTLMTNAIKLTNRLQIELFPIGTKWATLVPGAFIEENLKQQAGQELFKIQEIIFAAIGLSNFDLSIAEFLLELVVAGTACMLVQRGDDANPIVYQTVPQSFVAFREGAYGMIDLISRKHKMRLSLIKGYWDDASLDAVAHLRSQEDDDPDVDLIDVCYFDRELQVWYYDVLVMGAKSGDNHSRIVEREYKVNPWVIARWSKAAGEAQGRSLVMAALPDARVLSAVKSYILKQAALAISGVFLVRNDGMINANNVRIFPGATIPVKATGGQAGASIAPLQVGGQTDLAQLVMNDLINSIDKIMLNTGVPDIQDGVRSATEWLARQKDLQQDLGAPFSRVLKEGIVPMLEATIQILGEMQLIPLPASGKLKLNNGEISVKFASPLVQGQNTREIEAVMNAFTLTMQTAGMIAPEAAALSFVVEDFGAWFGEKTGMTPSLIRTKDAAKSLEGMAGAIAARQMAGAGQVGGAGVVPPTANGNAPLAMAA